MSVRNPPYPDSIWQFDSLGLPQRAPIGQDDPSDCMKNSEKGRKPDIDIHIHAAVLPRVRKRRAGFLQSLPQRLPSSRSIFRSQRHN